MARYYFVVCFVALAALMHATTAVPSPSPPHGTSMPVKWYSVSLDDKPIDRWTAIATLFKPEIVKVVDYVESQMSPTELKVLTEAFGTLENFVPNPLADEVRSVANAVGLDPALVLVMNLYYELTAACTSIVAQTANGTILHGRNLDYGLPDLQELTINVNFTQNGTSLFTTTTYAGLVGALTGSRHGAFSLSIDERWGDNATIWDNFVEMIEEGGLSIAMTLRTVLEFYNTFDRAVTYLSNVHLMSIEYIIVGGVQANEGAVITRDRNSAADVWRLDSPNRWFLVETNYDHWKPVPASDDRRTPANQRMNATTLADITIDYLNEKVMSVFPTLNARTTYTTMMAPATGYYTTVTRNNDN
eukprot:m.164954 g.164954  ORF g.164954 m.164954 type:complete len:360 (+) comp14414_c0_seq1:219-1298(+)